ncbi:MAG: alpha-hydroxy-acid oxidizing protein [Treponema sp.]|nr:alpha-hydroxy-acid oxidizing protein [Treponema sp.]
MAYTRLSDANEITARYMDSILLKERLIDSVLAKTETNLLGESFSSPLLTPAFSHLSSYKDRPLTGLEEYSLAAKKSNILNFVGMMENDMFRKILDTGAKTVRIVKPYADNSKVRDQFKFAEDNGAFGIGMDIDHIFGKDGYDIVLGEEMAAQTFDMLHSYISSSKLPFVVKGVLSCEDAVKSAQAGAKAIIISHHHGRLPYAVPPLKILPEIKKALSQIPEGKNLQIFVDCGIASGADLYKAIALGADAAAFGRSMLPSLENGGKEGVMKFIEDLNDEFRFIMSSTGFSKVADIDGSALIF